jgi:signal transduction histidine kinase
MNEIYTKMREMHYIPAIMIALFIILPATICAQTQNIDSLINVLNMQKPTPAGQSAVYEMDSVNIETEKTELRLAALEAEKIRYSTLSISAIIVLLSLVVLFIVRHRLAVAKRKLTEQEVIVANQQIKQLEQEKQIIATKSVLDGETAERTRMARDLHDGLGGMLSIVKLHLENVENLQNAREALDKSIEELHRVAHHLMPAALLRYGLKTSLEDFCRSFPNVQFDYFGNQSRLNHRIEILIYRCALELVNNAIKHARASAIQVQLVQESDRISLTVVDDGCGFDTAKLETPKLETPKLGVSTSGMGLENLRTRITACNGKINFYSSPGKGTEVYVEIYLQQNECHD